MQNFTELYEVERRYEELAHKMSTPDAAANADEYARMMRDYKELTPLIEEYRRYTDLQQQEKDAKEMLAAESDPAFAAMVQQELCEIARNLAQSEENLRLLLIPKDADDEKSVILEIRAGAGGEEAALFAHSLWRMYTMYADKRGWQTEVMNTNPRPSWAAYKEIVFRVAGDKVYTRPQVRERCTPRAACARDRESRAACTPRQPPWLSFQKRRNSSFYIDPKRFAYRHVPRLRRGRPAH